MAKASRSVRTTSQLKSLHKSLLQSSNKRYLSFTQYRLTRGGAGLRRGRQRRWGCARDSAAHPFVGRPRSIVEARQFGGACPNPYFTPTVSFLLFGGFLPCSARSGYLYAHCL
ncbi:hypothetical protein PCAR4_720019 [Paraburkholderia caribensis]|nr:hypothetical protein PCAR4_720019 [Paraburkholderia caribensis]